MGEKCCRFHIKIFPAVHFLGFRARGGGQIINSSFLLQSVHLSRGDGVGFRGKKGFWLAAAAGVVQFSCALNLTHEASP